MTSPLDLLSCSAWVTVLIDMERRNLSNRNRPNASATSDRKQRKSNTNHRSSRRCCKQGSAALVPVCSSQKVVRQFLRALLVFQSVEFD